MSRLHKHLRSVASRTVTPRLNHIGDEREIVPVSLPTLTFTAEPPPDDNAAKAEAIITLRIVRSGRDAWEEITKAENFDALGKTSAQPSLSSKLMRCGAAVRMHRGAQPIVASFPLGPRSMDLAPCVPRIEATTIALHENIGAITAWRAG